MAKWGDDWRNLPANHPALRGAGASLPAPADPPAAKKPGTRWRNIPHVLTIGGEIFEAKLAKELKIAGLFCRSRREAEHKRDLVLEQKAGIITDLIFERTFPLQVASTTGPIVIGDYVADATYMRAGVLVVHDTKGQAGRTPLYQWKKRHFNAQYAPLAITEVE